MHIPLLAGPLFRLDGGPWLTVTRIKQGKFLLTDGARVGQCPPTFRCGKYSQISRLLQRSLLSKLSKDERFMVCVDPDLKIFLFNILTLRCSHIEGLHLEEDIKEFDVTVEGNGVEVLVLSGRYSLYWSGVTVEGCGGRLKGTWRSVQHNLPPWTSLSTAYHQTKGWVAAAGIRHKTRTEMLVVTEHSTIRTLLPSSSSTLVSALHPSTSLLSVGSGDRLQLVSVSTGEVLLSRQEGEVGQLEWCCDGNLLLVISPHNTISFRSRTLGQAATIGENCSIIFSGE